VSKLIILRGLPASGKSTWAIAWVAADPSTRLRVNRDDIRFQLYGKYWGEGVDEQMVTKVEEAMVKAGLDAGKDVVVDATHLASRYVKRWYNYGVPVEIKSFHEYINNLVARDLERGLQGQRHVGEAVIRAMASRYQIKADGTLPPPPEVEVSTQWTPAVQKGRPAFIVDIDGTIANHDGIRSPYDTSLYHLDATHEDVINAVDTIRNGGFDMLLVSGRDEAFRAVTEEWLTKKALLEWDGFFMRPEGDTRNDAIVKHELYHKHIAGRYNVLGVFDDRGRVLRMWRAIGLTTFAVGDTDNYNF